MAVLDMPDSLAGGGEMAKVVAAKNWAETPLWHIDSWPQRRARLFVSVSPRTSLSRLPGVQVAFRCDQANLPSVWIVFWNNLRWVTSNNANAQS